MAERAALARASRRSSPLSAATIALALVTLIALAIRIAYASTNPILDDAFITFRYVRNIAHGIGFVYNPGERVLGTTTPLFTLLLTPFAFVGLDIPTTARVITIFASTASVVMVFLIGRRMVGETVAILGAMLLAISTNNVWAASTGLETELNVLILLALVFAYLEGRYLIAAVLAAIALLTRLDDLILVGIILADYSIRWLVGRRGRALPVRALLIFAAVLAPWLIFAFFYFGSPIPNSIVGKAASYREPVADNLLMYARQYGFLAGNLREAAGTLLLVLGVVYVIRRRDEYLVVPAYFSVYSAAFVLLGARLGSGWYWQPLWPMYCLLVAGGTAFVVRLVAKSGLLRRNSNWVKPLAAAGLVLFGAIWLGAIKSRFIDPRPPDDLEWAELALAGQWIDQNTPPGATVGLETFGAVGWYSNRVIIDEGGLISPQVARINDQTGRPDYATILKTFRPDYYLAWIHGELDAIDAVPSDKEWLDEHYQPLKTFDVGIGRAPYFMLFRKSTD